MIQKRLLLLVPAAVVFAAAMSGTAAVVGPDRKHSCARTSVDLTTGDGDFRSVDIVVLVNGSSGVSISQQVVQSNERTRVDIDVESGDMSLNIIGETVENGSLVLNVTRDGTVVNESVVVNGSDDRAVVFHIDGDGDVRISRERDPKGCACDVSADELGVNVDAEGVRVDVNDGVEVNIGGEDTDDDDAVHETDGRRDVDC